MDTIYVFRLKTQAEVKEFSEKDGKILKLKNDLVSERQKVN